MPIFELHISGTIPKAFFQHDACVIAWFTPSDCRTGQRICLLHSHAADHVFTHRLRRGTARSRGVCVFSAKQTLSSFQSGHTNFHSHQECRRVLAVPPNTKVQGFSILAILVGVKSLYHSELNLHFSDD